MELRRLCWLGVRAREPERMVGFLRDVMGLRVEIEEHTTTELSLKRGDRIQVFGPEDPYYALFEANACGPVPLFEVDDVRQARAELERAGAELIGSIEHDEAWEWIHFRAPDGNLYELASRRK
jgi:catechol 2,3-dioxygenase-like lactoylglutathione lyase family enzyme